MKNITLALCLVLGAGLTAQAQQAESVVGGQPPQHSSASERKGAGAEVGGDERGPAGDDDEQAEPAEPPSGREAGPSFDRGRKTEFGFSGPRGDFSPPTSDQDPGEDPPRPDGEDPPVGGESAQVEGGRPGFRWGPAFRQSMLLLTIQHGYAMTQPKTRQALRGPFFKDYARSVRSLHGWADGGRFFTNYVAHPMQGSLTGFIQVQNDPKGARQRFGGSGAYWRSRMKALAWSAAWSTQFEIGPLSQASIGNVGLHGKQTYVDLVITPTGGLGLLVAEDALDKYLVERIERGTDSRVVRIAARMMLNPTRSVANVLRFKKPWHRDAGLR